MKESSEHLLALVNSLLDFYRLDINKVDVDNVAFCPAQLFETIREALDAPAPVGDVPPVTPEKAPETSRAAGGDKMCIRDRRCSAARTRASGR